MPHPNNLSDETKSRIRKLYLVGWQHACIAETIGVSQSSVSKHTRDLPSRGRHWKGHHGLVEIAERAKARPTFAPGCTPRYGR